MVITPYISPRTKYHISSSVPPSRLNIAISLSRPVDYGLQGNTADNTEKKEGVIVQTMLLQLLCSLLLSVAVYGVDYSDYHVCRFQSPNVSEVIDMLQKFKTPVDIWSANSKFVDIRVHKDVAKELPCDTIIEDLPATIQKTYPSSDQMYSSDDLLSSSKRPYDIFFDEFRDLDTIYTWLDLLELTFPDLVKIEWVGQTFEGRDMKALHISTGNRKLNPEKKTILILGGSLGARTINNTLIAGLQLIRRTTDVQFIWQTGKIYHQQVTEAVKAAGEIPNLFVTDFIKDMAAAYAAADLVISRAGAGSISEFCLLNKPVILVPSPNVAEDHQTKNALALVNKQAAIYVKDAEAENKLLPVALETIANAEKLSELSENIAHLALPDSAVVIAKEVIKLAQQS